MPDPMFADGHADPRTRQIDWLMPMDDQTSKPSYRRGEMKREELLFELIVFLKGTKINPWSSAQFRHLGH